MMYDVIVIGGGPGGYVAAIRAAKLGAKVSLIEKDRLGGTCLNRGCIPTKALYRSAEILKNLKNISEFGVNVHDYSIDVSQIQTRKGKVVDDLVLGIEKILKANGVDIIYGTATFKDKNTVIVNKEDGSTRYVLGDNIIISTGSKPVIPPFEGAKLDGIYTSEEILDFKEIPKSLTVVGGGVVGMELACIFNALGARINIIEFLPRILVNVDSDITKRLTPVLKKSGITINTGTKVEKIIKTETGYKVFASNSKGAMEIESEKVLISTGRCPVTEGLKLDSIGVKTSTKGIVVDENFETTVKGLYAIGDVNGISMLAHVASHQGEVVAKKIMKVKEERIDPIVPSCIFIFPEIASVGITEDEAKEKKISYNTSKFMFGANGKALTLGEGQGFIKLLATKGTAEDKNDEILIGAHIMGPHGSDIIHECNLAITKKMKIGEIKNIIHAHPTLSETFIEAVNGLVDEAIHILPLKHN